MSSQAFTNFRTISMPAGTTANATTGLSVDLQGASALTFYVVGTGTISGGTLVLEEAATYDYTGTWSQITTITLSTISGGATVAYHAQTPAAWIAVRPRLSAAVTGGGSIQVIIAAV